MKTQRNYADTTWWDTYVENIADEGTYLRRKFRQDVTDKSTGISQEALRDRLAEIVANGKASGEPWRVTKARCFAAEVNEQSIDVSPLDWFPAIAIWDRLPLPIWRAAKWDRIGEVNARMLPEWVKEEWAAGNADGTWAMWQDFDHSVPDWRAILPLGFPGMKARLEGIAIPGDPFHESCAIAMDAILSGIDRFIEQGKKNFGASHSRRLEKEVACLVRLRNGTPQTAYDMMMFVWLYFFFSEHLDGIQCRSLTELDVFITPYYDADIAAGRTTEAEFREQLRHFLWQWGSISNYWNQPVGLGGTNADGTSAYNHVSKIILDVMDECALTTPKFLAKVAPNTPDWAMDKMLDMARRHRSIAFIGEEPASPRGHDRPLPQDRLRVREGAARGKSSEPDDARHRTCAQNTARRLRKRLSERQQHHHTGRRPWYCRRRSSRREGNCLREEGFHPCRFHKSGGSVIQFTVFSAEELRDAQAHPEKYENLQVRVCGWNVRWNDLSRTEQNAYIIRAENVAQA